MNTRPPVAIAGATGFVGRALAQALGANFRVIGLSRNPPADSGLPIEWRPCDLFSLMQAESALKGVDQAVYLVHSMFPSARLTQGAFQDFDLVCADNFARAAASAGVRQIVYLGGLIPAEPGLSRHLKSRLEVERTLGSRGVPVVALRAGIVIGPGGSSYKMFRDLVKRMSFIPCPAWTKSLTQPAALDDVLALLRYCLEHPSSSSGSHDIGSPDVMSYRELLERTARLMGLKRTFFSIPATGAWGGGRWLSWITGVPQVLAGPLLESAGHSMVAKDFSFQKAAGVPGIPFDAAVKATLAKEGVLRRGGAKPAPSRRKNFKDDVRSVERMALPAGKSARWAAEFYSAWLPRIFRTLLKAEVDSRKNVRFVLLFPRICLLELTFDHERSRQDDRQVFYITGGLLAKKVERATSRPRLEFREVLGGSTLLVAIHDYRPTLPWPVYNLTQAIVHRWVMRRFSARLSRMKL